MGSAGWFCFIAFVNAVADCIESLRKLLHTSATVQIVLVFFFNLHTVLVYYIVQSVKNQVTEVGSGKLYGWSKCNF